MTQNTKATLVMAVIGTGLIGLSWAFATASAGSPIHMWHSAMSMFTLVLGLTSYIGAMAIWSGIDG